MICGSIAIAAASRGVLAVGLLVCAAAFHGLMAQESADAPAPQPAAPAPAPAAVDSPLVPPPFIDFADVTPPLQSFQYWLDTVTTSDEEFLEIVKVARSLPADAKLTASELREERIRRLHASFDFEAMLDAAEAGKQARGREAGRPADEGVMTADERRNAKDAMVRLFLGTVTREKYAARNIRATRMLKEEGKDNPNWKDGTAEVEIDMFDTVERAVVRYRVHMKLFARGLMWRWYKSESMGEAKDTPAQKDGEATPADTAKAIGGLDAEIARLSEQLEGEEAKLKEMEDRLALLRERLSARKAERRELEREQDPYGTPELALRTAHKAMKDQNWEKFQACHTEAVRNNAGPAAKSRFLQSAKRDEVLSLAILETIADPSDSGKMKLKVRLTISFREQQKYDADAREAYTEKRQELRVVTISFLREDGKWLISDDL